MVRAVPTTSLASLRPWPARLALLVLIVICCRLASGVGGGAPATGAPERSDAALYRAIDQRVLTGENYYHAAAAEQRRRDYPLRPFVTVRLPTLAWLYRLAHGASGLALLMRLVAFAALIAMALRLRGLASRPLWLAASLLSALAAGVIVQPAMIVWHEAWAGVLIMLSLAVRSGRRWWPSVALGLAAFLFRELAFPYLVVMAAMALWERRSMEALGWAFALLSAIVALILHAQAVAAVVVPGDQVSQGWRAFGGWRFDLLVLRESSLFALLPRPIAGPLVLFALLGWGTSRSPYATRFALTLALWLGAFLLIGRPVNFYWGLMIAPTLPIGLPLALPALRDLLRAAFPDQGNTASVSNDATSPVRPLSTPLAE